MGTDPAVTSLLVPRRFCGPPASGNGGYSAGALAALVGAAGEIGEIAEIAEIGDVGEVGEVGSHRHDDAWPTVEVSLHAPPPLDVEVPVELVDGVVVAATGTTRVATARLRAEPPVPVGPVGVAEAAAATDAFPGWRSHAFPTCFVCGIERDEGDGLRIFPGPTSPGGELFAAPWTPHPSTAEDWHVYADARRKASAAITWAALDCPGGWAGGFADRPMVLARMTARLASRPVVGVPHVVVGEHRGTEGRKTMTASSLYDADGALVGTSEQLWIAIDPTLFR